MLLRVLKGFSHAIIIVLAFVLTLTIITRESSDAALEEFKKDVNQRIDSDKLSYENKLKTLEDNLNRYQQLRESRAQLYSKRLDELYDLYKKDPNPIDSANIKSNNVIPVDGNFSYLEIKANKIDEKVDNLDNRLSSKISILEKKIELSEQQNKLGTKVINNNQSSAVINMPVPN